jgi:hypothetical protein
MVVLPGVLLTAEAQKPRPFPVALARLSVSFDDTTGEFRFVRIAYRNREDEEFRVGMQSDYYIKTTNTGKETVLHQEFGDRALFLTDFEARQLHEVSKTLIETLEKFEQALSNKEWDKCQYLDAYLPRFLKGFWYLYNAARCDMEQMPQHALPADSLYDISMNSKKSIARILIWRQEVDHVTKLRIVSKELIYQTKIWQKKELTNKKRNKEVRYGEKFEMAFELFVRFYFNLKPPPEYLLKKGRKVRATGR